MSRKVKKFKVCSIQHRSKLIFGSKISFLFGYYPFRGSFDHREMWYTQRNHIDNIITNSCKLICNIPGSGTNLEFHLVSQDIYLIPKWFGFYCLIFRPILYKDDDVLPQQVMSFLWQSHLCHSSSFSHLCHESNLL